MYNIMDSRSETVMIVKADSMGEAYQKAKMFLGDMLITVKEA